MSSMYGSKYVKIGYPNNCMADSTLKLARIFVSPASSIAWDSQLCVPNSSAGIHNFSLEQEAPRLLSCRGYSAESGRQSSGGSIPLEAYLML